jgi:hypothetical protein
MGFVDEQGGVLPARHEAGLQGALDGLHHELQPFLPVGVGGRYS